MVGDGQPSDLLSTASGNSDQHFGRSWTSLARAITQEGPENIGQTQGGLIRQAWPLLATLQGQILAQITSRDYSLVTQTSGLAVYRPAFRGNESGGVRLEITHNQALRQIGINRSPAVILHPDSDEQDTLLENFKLLVDDWRSDGKLDGSPENFSSLYASLSFDDLVPIQDGETDLLKGQAISELLRRWEIEFLTRAPRAMAPETAAVAREQESERGNRFSGLHSYISELVNTDDVVVISEDLSIQEFAQRVFNRINGV